MLRALKGETMARAAKTHTPAIAYLRTSSASNVGADKDSQRRQRQAVAGFAKRNDFELVGEHYDAAVRGGTRLTQAQTARRYSTGSRLMVSVIFEDASRFARELMAQELAIVLLTQRGVRLLTANGDDLTDTTDPSRKMMRQSPAPSLSTKKRAWLRNSLRPAGASGSTLASVKAEKPVCSGSIKKADTDEARTPYQKLAEPCRQ